MENVKKVLEENYTHVKCPHCSYQWLTKSKRLVISCSSCNKKFAIKENIINN